MMNHIIFGLGRGGAPMGPCIARAHGKFPIESCELWGLVPGFYWVGYKDWVAMEGPTQNEALRMRELATWRRILSK